MSGLNPANEAVLVGVAKVLGLKDAAALAELRPSGLWKLTQRELLDAARTLGLTKVSRLNKEALLARVWEALADAGAGIDPGAQAVPEPAQETPPTQPAPAAGNGRWLANGNLEAGRGAQAVTPAPSPQESAESQPGAAHKFDVGQDTAAGDLSRLRAEAQSHIPWGYAVDRVTALPIDPERLYAYWEVTDAGIARAREGLGAGGPGAWLSVRVYDVTGRLFDGTNAHSYFDHRVGRDDRQWFFRIDKPTSQTLVEIGMKSEEGFFVKIARSGRIEFPRREPVAWSEPEWLTVSAHTGAVEGSQTAGVGYPPAVGGPGAGPGPGPGSRQEAGPGGGESASGVRRRIWAGRFRDGGAFDEFEESWNWEGWEWSGEGFESELFRTLSWQGETEISSWSAGPFDYPVELPGMEQESWGGGPARVFRAGGRTHVLWGPWQVVIRGLGAQAQHQVISRWEVYRSWTTDAWRELVKVSATPAVGPGGASELRLGASERWGRGQSELRLRGASERWLRGASELRLGGASERAFLGASQWVARGASEKRWGGASEWRLVGASERLYLGASERRLGGASERQLGGASERQLGGASERQLGASEARLADAPAGDPGSPSSWPSLSPSPTSSRS